jgi:DNA-binding LytR/AlgR family response regulator
MVQKLELNTKKQTTLSINMATYLEPFFCIKSSGVYIRIIIDEICYIEALKDYVKIVTKNNRYVVHSTIGLFYSKLNKSQFSRVHRSFVVNINCIDEIHVSDIILKNIETKIPMSKNFKHNLLETLLIL